MPMPEAGRLSAHVLLDTVSVFDPDDESADAMNRALRRFNEVEAVTATFDDETDVLDLDATNLIGGACLVVERLLALYTASTGISKHEAIVQVREFLDEQEIY